MTDTPPTGRRRPHVVALIWIWGLVTVFVGPVLILAQFAAAFGAFGGPGAAPVEDAVVPALTFTSLLGGVGALVIGGRWWTALLAGSPGLLTLLTGIDDPVRNLFAIMLLASPAAAIIGVLFAVGQSNDAVYGPAADTEDDEVGSDVETGDERP